jgi:hypothetical protein
MALNTQQEWDHERRRAFRNSKGNAIDGRGELRSGPQGLREIRLQRASHRWLDRGARETVRAGAKDIGSKAMSYAEKNVQASLDYAQSLLQAKDLTEVMRLHSEYVQAQMRALAEQASEMGQIVSRAAMDAAKPKT